MLISKPLFFTLPFYYFFPSFLLLFNNRKKKEKKKPPAFLAIKKKPNLSGYKKTIRKHLFNPTKKDPPDKDNLNEFPALETTSPSNVETAGKKEKLKEKFTSTEANKGNKEKDIPMEANNGWWK